MNYCVSLKREHYFLGDQRRLKRHNLTLEVLAVSLYLPSSKDTVRQGGLSCLLPRDEHSCPGRGMLVP